MNALADTPPLPSLGYHVAVRDGQIWREFMPFTNQLAAMRIAERLVTRKQYPASRVYSAQKIVASYGEKK